MMQDAPGARFLLDQASAWNFQSKIRKIPTVNPSMIFGCELDRMK
jgi:hypothetical protein